MDLPTPLIACSSGTPIVAATTSALAPGYRVLTWIVGGRSRILGPRAAMRRTRPDDDDDEGDDVGEDRRSMKKLGDQRVASAGEATERRIAPGRRAPLPVQE